MVPQGLHQASSHLQQLQAHLLRTSPYLSPQNSFIHAASYLPPPVALFGAASTSGKENIIEIEFIPCNMYTNFKIVIFQNSLLFYSSS